MAHEQATKKDAPAPKVKEKGGNKFVKAIAGIPKRMITAIKNTWAELKKVTWPGRKDLLNYTTIVLVFMVMMAVVVGLLDIGATNLVKLIIDL